MTDNGKRSALPIVEFLQGGLTKREWFAGLALQGLLVNPTSKIEADAELAVIAADALLSELAKTEKP